MKSEVKALQGLAELTEERDQALKERGCAFARIRHLEQEVRDLNDRLYGRTANTILRYAPAEIEREVSANAWALRVFPVGASMMLSNRVLEDVEAPSGVIEGAIDQIVKRIAEGYRDQFRSAVKALYDHRTNRGRWFR